MSILSSEVNLYLINNTLKRTLKLRYILILLNGHYSGRITMKANMFNNKRYPSNLRWN